MLLQHAVILPDPQAELVNPVRFPRPGNTSSFRITANVFRSRYPHLTEASGTTNDQRRVGRES